MDASATSLDTLARLVDGQLSGDGSIRVSGAAPLYELRPGVISLLDGAALPTAADLRQLAALVVSEDDPAIACAKLIVSDPRAAFAQIVEYFLPRRGTAGRTPTSLATIDGSATIGPDCQVSPGVVIGPHARIGARCRLMPGVVIMDHSEIGDDCTLFPNVTLYERTRLGRRVTIHAGAVLGAYGFGYQANEGQHHRTAQLGHVVVEDDVELGACVTIDRGTYGSTRIGTGTKIDNQVMIGHNCQIGRHNLICSQVGIAGSCRTGDHVVLAGQVGLKDHIALGDGAIVGAQSGVMEDLPGHQIYLGSPATTQREQMQIMAIQRRLPELRRSVKTLEKNLQQTAAEPRVNVSVERPAPMSDERAA